MNISAYLEQELTSPVTTIAEVEEQVKAAIDYRLAAICVPPLMVKNTRRLIGNAGIKLATVIGFPYGYSAIEAKLAEVVLAIVDGADELNIVINLVALKNNDWQYLARELNSILPVLRNKQKQVKVILETASMTRDEIITCCDLYGAAGVDFIQLSTGISGEPVAKETITLVRKHLAENVGIKATSGMLTGMEAQWYIDAGATRLGCSNTNELVNFYSKG
jgi:deoxyribose-phosphate aldolase